MPRNHQMASVTVFLVFIFQEQLFPGSGLLHNWFLQGNHLLNFPNVCSFNVFKSITNFKGLNFNPIQEMLNQDFDDLRKSERKLWNRKKKTRERIPLTNSHEKTAFGEMLIWNTCNESGTDAFLEKCKTSSRNWRIYVLQETGLRGHNPWDVSASKNLFLLFMGRVIFSHHSDQMFQINIKMRFRKKCFQSSSITKNA